MPRPRSSRPSGVVNPSSGAPGNAFGHCKANGNGHPNQHPAGCTTDTLTFAYEQLTMEMWAERVENDPTVASGKNPLGHWDEEVG